MKLLLWLLLVFGFIIHPEYKAVPLVINNQILTPLLKENFEDGTKISKIEILNDEEKDYLVRVGSDEKENCHISRTEMLKADLQGFQTYMMPIGGVTETCTGVGCTYCGFKKEGGCECKNFSGRCDHTISRNWEILRLGPTSIEAINSHQW